MFPNLFPKVSSFSKHFRSIANDIVEIARLIKEFTEASSDIESFKKRAEIIERRADDTAAEVVRLLNVSFITPFDREDIHFLINELDDIIDLSEDFIKNHYLYGVKESNGTFKKFAGLILESAITLETLVDKNLDPPRYTADLKKNKQKLYTLEDEGDEIFADSIHELFRNTHDPIDLIKKKDILEGLETVMDKFRAVGIAIENIVLKTR